MKRIQRRIFASFLAAAAVASCAGFASAAVLPPAVVAYPVQRAGIRDLGRADAQTAIRLAVTLQYRNEAALDQLIDLQSDPDSPLHGSLLTPEQFRAAFGPSQQTYQRVIALLQRAGFTVVGTFPNRTIVDVQAPAPVVERYFNTEIHRVSAGNGLHYANARPAYLPAELSDTVDFVLGFDNIEWFTPQIRPAPRGVVIPGTIVGPPLHGPTGGFGPLGFAQGYDFPVQHQIPGKSSGTTYDGTGRTAAMAMAGDPSDTDLTMFLAEYGINRTGTTKRVLVDKGPHNPSEGTLEEAALDYQTIIGLAPGANMRVYEFPFFDNFSVLDTYNTFVSENKADTLNSSFAVCETARIFIPMAIQKIEKQGVAQGQIFHAGTGDDGEFTYGCGSNVSITTPADAPATVAVGGTVLQTDDNGNWTSEAYWTDGSGGVSKVFKVPAFQKSVPTITAGGRNIPDVSFDANQFVGEAIVFEGQFVNQGGTSLASPIFGACMVEAEQVLGHRISGQFNKLVYRRWLQLGYGSGSTVYAHDITTGTPFGILVPGPGYDLATGIGSLDCFGASQAYLR